MPVVVIALREVVAVVTAAGFFAGQGSGADAIAHIQHVAQLQAFDQVQIIGHALILQTHFFKALAIGLEFALQIFEVIGRAENAAQFFHVLPKLLHHRTQTLSAAALHQAFHLGHAFSARTSRKVGPGRVRAHILSHARAAFLAEHHQIQKAVGAQTVGSMHAGAGRLARRVEAGHYLLLAV